jgi:hypothetical protein
MMIRMLLWPSAESGVQLVFESSFGQKEYRDTAPVTTRRCFVHPTANAFSDVEQDVGWDQRRFAAPAHQQIPTFHHGGPALEASWSHPTLTKVIALSFTRRIANRIGSTVRWSAIAILVHAIPVHAIPVQRSVHAHFQVSDRFVTACQSSGRNPAGGGRFHLPVHVSALPHRKPARC